MECLCYNNMQGKYALGKAICAEMKLNIYFFYNMREVLQIQFGKPLAGSKSN